MSVDNRDRNNKRDVNNNRNKNSNPNNKNIQDNKYQGRNVSETRYKLDDVTKKSGKITDNAGNLTKKIEPNGKKIDQKRNPLNYSEKNIFSENYYEDLDMNLLSKEEKVKYGQKKTDKAAGKKASYAGHKPDKRISKPQSEGKNRITKGACPQLKACGGCNILVQSYEAELQEKQKTVEQLLSKYCKVDTIIGMKNPTHYRHKVHVVFDHDKKGNPVSGVYQEGTHRVIPVESCKIHNQKADDIITTIRGLLKSFKIKTYDEDSGYGLLRHIMIRSGYASGEIMVVLVIASPIMPSKNNFVKALRAKHPEITTVVVNVNDKQTSMILGDKEQVIYGKGYIEDKLCGKVFRISAKSFYQINPEQAEIIYNKAIELAGLTGKETVIDAYCGTGTIGIIASEKAGKVIGVELNNDAVRDAINNAKRNDIHNIEFYNNDAGVFMSQMAAQMDTADVVFLDPPRSGSSEQFLEALTLLKPKKVVYVSCNPVTLERDLSFLMKKGYQAKRAVPVDMFPWTGHVETVILLHRKDT